MNHFFLILVCIVAVEGFFRFSFLSLLDSILQVTKKVTYILPNKKISDHWKERVIPVYALKMMKLSLQIFLILVFIISLFIIADILLYGFLAFTLSFMGSY